MRKNAFRHGPRQSLFRDEGKGTLLCCLDGGTPTFRWCSSRRLTLAKIQPTSPILGHPLRCSPFPKLSLHLILSLKG